jgi:hypothetical protein
LSDQCLEIYMAYPRRTARKYALKCIAKALLDLPFEEMLVRVQQFATFCRGQDNQFIPHPSTWFNQGRYYDIEDDPDCWPAAPEIPTAEAWALGRKHGVCAGPAPQSPTGDTCGPAGAPPQRQGPHSCYCRTAGCFGTTPGSGRDAGSTRAPGHGCRPTAAPRYLAITRAPRGQTRESREAT